MVEISTIMMVFTNTFCPITQNVALRRLKIKVFDHTPAPYDSGEPYSKRPIAAALSAPFSLPVTGNPRIGNSNISSFATARSQWELFPFAKLKVFLTVFI